jgi:hypothetical protein
MIFESRFGNILLVNQFFDLESFFSGLINSFMGKTLFIKLSDICFLIANLTFILALFGVFISRDKMGLIKSAAKLVITSLYLGELFFELHRTTVTVPILFKSMISGTMNVYSSLYNISFLITECVLFICFGLIVFTRDRLQKVKQSMKILLPLAFLTGTLYFANLVETAGAEITRNPTTILFIDLELTILAGLIPVIIIVVIKRRRDPKKPKEPEYDLVKPPDVMFNRVIYTELLGLMHLGLVYIFRDFTLPTVAILLYVFFRWIFFNRSVMGHVIRSLYTFPGMIDYIYCGLKTITKKIGGIRQDKNQQDEDRNIIGRNYKRKRQKITLSPGGWIGSVRITQLPAQNQPEEKRGWGGMTGSKFSAMMPGSVNSWLRSFSGNNKCGLSITINNGITWKFFTRARFRKKAYAIAQTILDDLKRFYTGLDGVVECVTVGKSEFRIVDFLAGKWWELKLAKPPYPSVLPVISNLCGLSKLPDLKLKTVILFGSAGRKSRDPMLRKLRKLRKGPRQNKEHLKEISDMWTGDPYRIKIFYGSINDMSGSSGSKGILADNRRGMGRQYEKINGDRLLRVLKSDVANLKNFELKDAKFKRAGLSTRRIILNRIVCDGSVITPNAVDFDFSHPFPMKKAGFFKNENFLPPKIGVGTISQNENWIGNGDGKMNRVAGKIGNGSNDFITLGTYLSRGTITGMTGAIRINSLTQSAAIFGKSGTGKTTLLMDMMRQLTEKKPGVGKLYLNISKEGEEKKFPADIAIIYGREKLPIPYFTGDPRTERDVEQNAANIASSLGLLQNAELYLINLMNLIVEKTGGLPETFDALLGYLLEYIEKNPYSQNTQADIMQAFEHRINLLRNNGIFIESTKLKPGLPDWFVKWLEGKDVYIDLTRCSKYTMRFFIITIFQMVRTYTKQLEDEKLLNTIIIDEAHVIFGRPRDNDTYDGHNIAMKKLDEIVSIFLKELRSRGVGAIFADQQPSSILSAPGTQPALRILFRLENTCASLFTNDPEEVRFIMGQENYTAVVINGTTGEKYSIRTDNPRAKSEIPDKRMRTLEISDGKRYKIPEFTGYKPGVQRISIPEKNSNMSMVPSSRTPGIRELQTSFIGACGNKNWEKAYLLLCRITAHFFRNSNINFDEFRIGEDADLFAILNGIKNSTINGNTAIQTTTLTKIEQLIRLNDFYEKKGRFSESFVETCAKLCSTILTETQTLV